MAEKIKNSIELKSEKIQKLKDYFEKDSSVLMAFLFGSRAKGISRKISDWDIGVYFKPKEYGELETEIDYPKENKIWSDLIDILETDDVDLVVLNRARPELVYSILNSGLPLVIKNRGLYLDLLCKTLYEAIDFREFAFDFWKIGERSKSLIEEDKLKIMKRLRFLEKEWEEFEDFKKMTWKDYQDNSTLRRSMERWIENLVIASIDIAKIFLASEKERIPDSYQDILKVFTCIYLKFPENVASKFSSFAKLRNVVVHEYLDIKWKQIKNFVEAAEKMYPKFIKKVSQMIK